MIELLFPSPEQKVAAFRSIWQTLGAFCGVLVSGWAFSDAGMLDKPVLGPAVVAAVIALFGRAVVEGRIDKNKGNA